MNDEIEKLESRLSECVPKAGEDGVIGDGSYEHTSEVFERAFDRAHAIASRAIELLRSKMNEAVE